MASNASYVIDAAQTFSTVILMGSVPRTKFQSDEVDRAADGTPKWTVGLAVTTISPNGMPPVSEVINVTCASPGNPCEGLAPGTQVQVEGFRVGISAPEQRERKDGNGTRLVGGKPFFSCTAVKQAQAWSGRKSDAA